MKISAFLLVVNILFLSSVTFAQQKYKLNFEDAKKSSSTQIKSKSPKGAMIRSAIIPGWGQLYNNKYLKSLVYLGSESYFVYRYYQIDQDVNKLKNDKSFNATAERIKNKEFLRNGWAWLFSAGYLLALGDAFVDAHLYGLNNNTDLSIGLGPDETYNTLQMKLNLTF